MPSGDSLKLCLTVMSQLCEISSMYSEMLIISNGIIEIHTSLNLCVDAYLTVGHMVCFKNFVKFPFTLERSIGQLEFSCFL